MKPLYNKALMYQFFYLGKWALLVSMLIYGIVTYGILNTNLTTLSFNISSLEGNTLDNSNESYVILLCLILFLLYVVVTGFNKRSNMTFLTSGPYSKEEIKKNEILFLAISLFLLVFTFLYINICLYLRYNSLLSLANSEYIVLFSSTMRLLIVGTAFIAYLTFMDMLFSNTIISILAMIGTPIILTVNVTLISYIAHILNSFHLYYFSLGRVISNIVMAIINYVFGNRIIYDKTVYISIIIILIITVIAFLITWRINKNFALNKINNFFAFPRVEGIVFSIISFTISLVGLVMIIRTLLNFNYLYYSGTNPSVRGTIITLVLLGLCLAFSYIINNLLKKLFKGLINK